MTFGRCVGSGAVTAALCLAAGIGVPGTAAAPHLLHDSASAGAPTGSSSWRARIVVPTLARAAPRRDARPTMRVGTAARWNGGPVSLLVLDATEDRKGRLWLRVLLPQRPNGTTGWIAAERAVVRRTRWRVVVDVDRRTVSLLHDGQVRGSWPAVVGAPSTPTPRGLFAVGERIRQPDANDFIGSWAVHLTAYSEVLDNYGGGPGTIGIHGRGGASLRDPLGSAASHGCIRIDNDPVSLLARRALEGTPVRIR